jgi:lipopolysaccharide transport system permease protein
MAMANASGDFGPTEPAHVTVIQPESGWRLINFEELKEYRDLFFFLVWRDIKVLYAQTILGFAWAILQPLTQIAIFTIVFGRFAKVPTDGIPYSLFCSVAIVPWTYMSQAMSASSQSLVTGQALLDKIYFPRLIFPITPVLAKLVDFFISMLIVLGIVVYYQVMPTWQLLMFPFMVVYMISIASGVGLWLSSLAIRFRDVKYAMAFVVQMLMYSAPIVYSASTIPEKYRWLYSLNPLVGLMEGFRSCLLGTPIPWQYIAPGALVGLLIFISGAMYFKRMEKIFVDVI